jgi:hypothetical protein
VVSDRILVKQEKLPAKDYVNSDSKITRLKRIYNPEDEERILNAASKNLHANRADLILVHEEGGYVVRNTVTGEQWEVDRLNSLPEIEPAN